jgi:ECF transporter S component (folate family)
MNNNVKKRSGSRSIRVITTSAILIALEIVLNRFCSINTLGWKIGFSFVPIVAAAVIYGPYIGAAVGGLGDLIGAILFPIGPYFPGFTVCAALMGFVYGLFLCTNSMYGPDSLLKFRNVSLIRNIIPAVLINGIVIGLFINTIWVSILYGSKTYWGWFMYRLPEYALMVPVKIIIIPIIVKLCGKIKKTIG